MSLAVAVAALEAVADDNGAPDVLRIRAASLLAVRVRGTDPGSPQADTLAKLIDMAETMAQARGRPEARVAAAELLLLLGG